MFMAEIGIMRKLSHPYIIRFLGCGVITEQPALSAAPGTAPKHFLAVVRPPPPHHLFVHAAALQDCRSP